MTFVIVYNIFVKYIKIIETMKNLTLLTLLLIIISTTFAQDKDTTLNVQSDTIQALTPKSSAPQRSTSNGSLGTLIITTNYGTTEIGAQNSSYSHNNTSLPFHYFNKGIVMNGALSSYSGLDLKLQTGGTSRIFIKQNGCVGIGRDQSDVTFAVYNNANPGFQLRCDNYGLLIGVASGDWSFVENSKQKDVVFRTFSTNVSAPYTDRQGMIFHITNNTGDGNSYIKFGDRKNGNWFAILNNKTVRIDGTVYATEINVKTDVWSDFVFNKDYKLRSLDEVEEYINANKCLPDVPSEAEVKESGVDVAKMNAILLQKVEELTLYVIKQQEEIKELKNKIDSKK